MPSASSWAIANAAEKALFLAEKAEQDRREAKRQEQQRKQRALIESAAASLAAIVGDELVGTVEIQFGVPGVYFQTGSHWIGGQLADDGWRWFVSRSTNRPDLEFGTLEELGLILRRYWSQGNEYDYTVQSGYYTQEEFERAGKR